MGYGSAPLAAHEQSVVQDSNSEPEISNSSSVLESLFEGPSSFSHEGRGEGAASSLVDDTLLAQAPSPFSTSPDPSFNPATSPGPTSAPAVAASAAVSPRDSLELLKQVKGLDISALSPTQIQDLSWGHLKLMSREQLVMLERRINNLQIAGLDAPGERALAEFMKDSAGVDRYEFVLSAVKYSYGSDGRASQYFLPNRVVSGWDVKTVSEGLAALHVEMILPRDMKDFKVSALDPALFAHLNPEQLGALTPFQISRLTLAQIVALSPEQLRSFSDEQCQHFSTEALRSTELMSLVRGASARQTVHAHSREKVQEIVQEVRDRYMGKPSFHDVPDRNWAPKSAQEQLTYAIYYGDSRNPDQFPGVVNIHRTWESLNRQITSTLETLSRIPQLPEDSQPSQLQRYEDRIHELLDRRDQIQRVYRQLGRFYNGEDAVRIGRDVVRLDGHAEFLGAGKEWKDGRIPPPPEVIPPTDLPSRAPVPPPPSTPAPDSGWRPVRTTPNNSHSGFSPTLDRQFEELNPYLNMDLQLVAGRNSPLNGSGGAAALQEDFRNTRELYLHSLDKLGRHAELIGSSPVGGGDQHLQELCDEVEVCGNQLLTQIDRIGAPNSGVRFRPTRSDHLSLAV